MKMSQVMTTEGLLERAQLQARDEVFEDDTSRTLATEWYLGDKLVRRDVWVNVLTPVSMGASNGG